MSPEQLLGHPADARSDIFSFGVVLYELIAHRRPFEGEEPEALIDAMRLPPRPITELRPDVPPQLARTIGSCLAIDPAARCQTARELSALLKPVVGAAPERSRPVDWRSGRKWLWLAIVVGACALLLGGARYWNIANTGSVDSIAVLPFASAERSPDTEYLSDGITEGIINSLSAIPRLKVIARTTVFEFKYQKLEPRRFGRQLGVEALLTGKITHRGDSIMIQTELVNVADGSQLWGARFQRNIADLQSLQGDIAQEIADKLRLRLKGDQQTRLTKRYTENSEAYQLYLKAMYSPWNFVVPRWINTHPNRIDYLQQAIAIDPGFARAYAALAASYYALGNLHYWPAKKAFQLQKEAASKALELDDGLGEAHFQLALVFWELDWDWPGADREFKRAIDLNTISAHALYSRFLMQTGRMPEGLIEAQRALEVDPLSRGDAKRRCVYSCYGGPA